jgi:PAS domain S-box-containing protein
MSKEDQANILMVDDQPGKLLSYEAILSDLGENLIKAKSAREALEQLLHHDIAVVLMDVCMPEMDGFELADMMHQHPRFQKTAIIFISAVHLTDLDRIKGYQSGAVDYISVPVVPELLRAKVSLFAELYRKTRQLERLNSELEQRVEERTEEIRSLNSQLEQRVADLETIMQVLRESEETLRTVFENGYAAVILHVPDGSIIDVNERFLAMYRVRREDAAHLKIADISSSGSPIDTLPAAWAKVLSGESQFFEWRSRRPHDGSEFDVEVFLSRIGLHGGREAVLANVRDISHRKRVEDEKRLLQIELAHAQKMEAIGQMAGGVAHDFNNLLNVISGYSELALGDPDRVLDSLTQIRKATKTATSVTRQLLVFSRKDVLEPQTINVCEVVRETATMLPRLLGEHIQIRTDTCAESCASRMAPGQLEQVIMNLAANARDAMPGGGTLTIRASTCVVDETAGRVLGGLPHGEYVVCSISDTGHGIAADTLPRIFEPFFTTKASGKGTGLGLATVRGIVNQNGGRIFIDSAVGRGTTFTFYLPRVEEGVTSVAQSTAILTELPRGSETILLVEDSAALSEMTKVFLQTQGYTVYTATNGVEALKVLERNRAQIDLLFTDVVMPLMSGPELVQRVKQLRPQLKVLFASGYVGELLEQHGISTLHSKLIEKPYSFESLSSNIREVLDSV